jgi:predicted GNAT superfamily acetyltransferase
MNIASADLESPDALRARIEADIAAGVFTWSDLARALGWTCTRASWRWPRPDTSRVKRVLGASQRGDGTRQKKALYSNLVRIAEAAGYDPVEVGL